MDSLLVISLEPVRVWLWLLWVISSVDFIGSWSPVPTRGSFAAKCEAFAVSDSQSKSTTMVLCWNTANWGVVALSKAVYCGVYFTSEGKRLWGHQPFIWTNDSNESVLRSLCCTLESAVTQTNNKSQWQLVRTIPFHPKDLDWKHASSHWSLYWSQLSSC